MADSKISQPFVPPSGNRITATIVSSKISGVTQVIMQYNKVVTVNIRFTISGALDSTEQLFSGLPIPKDYVGLPVCCQKILGGGNYIFALTGAGGAIRNDWDGVTDGQYCINCAYIAN